MKTLKKRKKLKAGKKTTLAKLDSYLIPAGESKIKLYFHSTGKVDVWTIKKGLFNWGSVKYLHRNASGVFKSETSIIVFGFGRVELRVRASEDCEIGCSTDSKFEDVAMLTIWEG